MKKRILALALAGTTAFSVFGGLTAFAASEHEDSEAFANDYTLTKVTTNDSGFARFDGKIFADVDLVTVMDFEDVMAEPVVSGTTYFYDFLDDLNDEYRTDYGQADVEKAIEKGLEPDDGPDSTELSKVLGGGELVANLTIKRETGYGDRGTIREDVIDAFEDFIAGISFDLDDYDYLYDYDNDGKVDDDVYNFAELIKTLEDWVGEDGKATKDDAYLKKATSRLVYMMQEYERLVDVNEYVTVKDIDTDAMADLYIAILEGRAEEDYDYTKDYRYWTAELEDLIEAYEDAETRGEYRTALAALKAEVLTKDSKAVKSDLSELAAAKATTMTVGTVTVDLYPAADYKVTSTTYTDEYNWYLDVLELAEGMYAMKAAYNFQGSVDVITGALLDAIAALEPTTEPRESRLLSLTEYVEKYDGLIESDYKVTPWKNYTKAMDYATTLLEGNPGEHQVQNAVKVLIPAAKAMDLCDNHTKVKASQITALKAAIKEGNAWLAKYDDTAAVSKVLAVTKAVDAAQDVLDDHTVDYKKNENCALVSEVENAIAAVDAALASTAVANGWLKTADGWMYGTETGYTTGWAKIGAVYYYFDENGIANESEWMYKDGKWYYFTSGCNAVAANWALIDGTWYYFNEDCSMVANGWKWINNKCYYFYASGAMAANTTIDGYVVGADGAWIA